MVALALLVAALSWLVTILVTVAAHRALRESRLATVEALQHLAEAERDAAAEVLARALHPRRAPDQGAVVSFGDAHQRRLRPH